MKALFKRERSYYCIIWLICSNLESRSFDGDKGELRLDPAEVCQILNLNPMTEEDLISYIPTLKRFSGYQLTLFLNEQSLFYLNCTIMVFVFICSGDSKVFQTS